MAGLIAKALTYGGGKDPRIAAIERATEFGRFVIPGTAGEDVWELSWGYTEELNGHHIYQYSGRSDVFSHYYELYTWAVYLKNGEFRFALPNTVSSGHTCIEGDYRKNDEDNSIYREFERKLLEIDISSLSLNETSELPGPWGVYISGTMNGTEEERAEYEELYLYYCGLLTYYGKTPDKVSAYLMSSVSDLVPDFTVADLKYNPSCCIW